MLPIVVFWKQYTATLNGRVLKLVPCENCDTEYVYVLEREAIGVGVSMYTLNNEGAERNAMSSADEALQSYLENDFDAVPCPVCGHYQLAMFPKLFETKTAWGPIAMMGVYAVGILDVVSVLYWGIKHILHPSDHTLARLTTAGVVLGVVGFIGIVLSALNRSRARNFNPNLEDQQVRLELGRSRAVTRIEFEAGRSSPAGSGPVQ